MIRFGIIGAAGRGNSFVRAIHAHPATELTALCDLRQEPLQANAADLGVEHTFTDASDMVRSGTVDAVVVGTPMQFHAPQAILALDHRVHVLSEVTAAVSVEEARDLVRAARRSEAVYMMAENYTYMKPNVLVKELARHGLFGELYYGEGGYIHELKAHNEATPWRRHWQTGVNGCTYPTHSLGPVLQWFNAGADRSTDRADRVVAVSAVGTGHHYRDPRGDLYEMEDSVTMMCRLQSGGMAQIRVDMLSDRPHNMVHYALQGTDGAYEGSDGHEAAPKVWLRSRHETPTWEPLAALEEEFLPDFWKNPPEAAMQAGHGGGDYWEVQDFVDAIVEEREPPIGIDAAMDMTLPGLVSQESLATGSAWVAVPDPRNWT
jgi:predicted dehydrogenase